MNKLRLRTRAARLALHGLVVNSFEVRALPVDELYCPVRPVPAFADEVARSIEREGLANPVIVIRGPREDLVAEMQATGADGNALPDTPVVNCVFGGTNRVAAARALGYTHIDCLLLPSFGLGIRVQELQRNSYSKNKPTGSVGTTAESAP